MITKKCPHGSRVTACYKCPDYLSVTAARQEAHKAIHEEARAQRTKSRRSQLRALNKAHAALLQRYDRLLRRALEAENEVRCLLIIVGTLKEELRRLYDSAD